MFTLCDNEMCDRACWCKRFTYKKYVPEEERSFIDSFKLCTAEYNYRYYKPKKAREIYERDHRDGRYNDESEQEEYENYNRESGMREDHEADIGTTETISGGDTPRENSVLQLQRSGDRRGSVPCFESFEDLYRYIINDLKSRRL